MGYKFGNRSLAHLESCHEDLQKIMKLAISKSKIDFGISEGHRSLSRQKQLYDEGKSKIDGIRSKGMHNHLPSLAVDIYTYHPDDVTRRKIAYDVSHLSYIAGIVDKCVDELLAKGEIKHIVRWGANWDDDGVIDLDQAFDDYPHFELKKI